MNSAVEQIKDDEGFRGKPYLCSAGKVTIGYGRNLDDNPLTIQEAEYLLNNDLNEVARLVTRFPFYKKLNPARRAVIINMHYNLGDFRFRGFVKFIAALKAGDYELAAVEMLNSNWAEQVGARAVRLANQMRTGEYYVE